MHATTDLLIGDAGEEPFDLVDPRRSDWGEVHLPTWPLCKPVPDRPSIKALCGKAPSPFTDGIGVGTHLNANRLVLQPGRSRQDDARPTRHRLTGFLRSGQQLQFEPLRQTRIDCYSGLAHHHHPPTMQMME